MTVFAEREKGSPDMDLLQQARAEIDRIDAEMAALFAQRMHAVADVARYKAQTGKPVFDPAREAAVLDQNAARCRRGPAPVLPRVFAESDGRLARVPARDAGPRHRRLPGRARRVEPYCAAAAVPLCARNFVCHLAEVFDAVQRGDAQSGVLPFENSSAGDVSTVLDLLYTHPDLVIARMCDLPIRQDLLGVPGGTLAQVRTVVSHTQALAQSSAFLQAARPGHPHLEQHRRGRALCGRTKRPGPGRHCQRRDRRPVRLAGAGAGREHRGRQHHPVYRDRAYGPAAGAAPGSGWRCCLPCGTSPASWPPCWTASARAGFNMECIKSRPLPHVPFEYYFYVQLVCPAQTRPKGCGALLGDLRAACNTAAPAGGVRAGHCGSLNMQKKDV